jgi:phenylacetate-CoA ligase
MKSFIKNLKYFINYKLKFNFLFYRYKNALINNNHSEELKLIKIKSLLYKAIKSEFYMRLYNEHNINIDNIKTLSDFEKLPVVTKDMIKGKEETLLTKSRWFLFKGFTSGSTGTPLTVYYDYFSVLKENAFVWSYREKCGLRFKDPVVSLRGNLKKSEFSSFDKYTNTLYLSSYNLNKKNILNYYSLISAFKPKAILAYPSSIYLLTILLKEMNLKLDVDLVFTSSETLYSYQHEIIENYLKTKIYDWYGNAERSIALQQLESGKYEEPFLYSHNEYGENEVITTSLNNFSYPLIRYRVDDVIKVNKNKEIVAILGRQDDFIELKDGTKVGRLDHIFKGVNGIEYAQIIQNTIGVVDINIVINLFNEIDRKLLISKIDERLGSDLIYTINIIKKDQIIYMKSGKFKMVINNVK